MRGGHLAAAAGERGRHEGDEDETDESENTEAVDGVDAPADEATAPAGGDDTADTDK